MTVEPAGLMTAQEVAQFLRIGRATVYDLIRRGVLTPVDLPVRRTLFRREDVQHLVESRRGAVEA